MKHLGFYHDGIVRLDPCTHVTSDYALEDDFEDKVSVMLTKEGILIDLIDADGELISTRSIKGEDMRRLTGQG